jgi:hypothetical protein
MAKKPKKQPGRNSKGQFVKGHNLGNRFKPGESGNPNGPPKRKTQLWIYFCKYMQMTENEIKKVDRKKLTLSQLSALKLAESVMSGENPGSERFAKYIIDRDEGKAVEHLIIGNEDVLTDSECDEIRQSLKNNVDQ